MKVSVIMPVYNPGIYFEECLETIFAQTLADFELICINDASKDALTLQMLETYQGKHSNMKVIHLEHNVGAGEARNRGLNEASGEYVIFLDSDEVYEKELLERMYKKCVEADADVCMCGYIDFDSQDEERKPIYDWKPNAVILEDRDNENYFTYWPMGPLNKLCKKSFLLKNNIYFQSLPSYNDVFYSLMVAKNAVRRTYVTDGYLIKSRKNIPNQISANRDPRNLLYAIDLMINELKQRYQYDEKVKKQLMRFMINSGFYHMKMFLDDNEHKEFYLLIRDRLLRNSIEKGHYNLYYVYYSFVNLPFESRWFEKKFDYFSKLCSYSEDLKTIFQDKPLLFLWGLGKRGEAFQKFCKEVNVKIDGVTDKKNENIGSFTEYGNKICSTDEIRYKEGIIAASNQVIYNELKAMQVKADIINLEEYCPD